MTNNTNKWDKLLGILLCLGVFLGLIYLSYSNQQKAEEFHKVAEQNSIPDISQSASNISLADSKHNRNKIHTEDSKEATEALIEDFHEAFGVNTNLKMRALLYVNDQTFDPHKSSNQNERFLESIAGRMAVMREINIFPNPLKNPQEADTFCRLWKLKSRSSEFFKNNTIKISFNPKEKAELARLKKYFNNEKNVSEALKEKAQIVKQKSYTDNIPANYSEYLKNLESLISIAEKH